MKVTGVKSVQRQLEKFADDLEDEVTDAVSDGLDETERTAKRRIIQQDAVHTGNLFRSFVQQTIDAGPTATRYSLDNYDPKAPLIEWGTGGHFGTKTMWGYGTPKNHYKSPSFSMRLIRAIEAWIITKPGFRRAGPPREQAPAIAKAIADGSDTRPSGTPPQPFMRPAWAVNKPKMKLNVRLGVKKAVHRF